MKDCENIFCDRFGYSDRNKVLSNFLCFRDTGSSVDIIAEDEGLNVTKSAWIIKDLEFEGIIKKYKVCKGTQFYILNDTNSEAIRWIGLFQECLEYQMKEYEFNEKNLFINKGDTLLVQKIIQKYNKEKDLTVKELLKLHKGKITIERIKKVLEFLEFKNRICISKGVIVWLYISKKQMDKLLKKSKSYESIKLDFTLKQFQEKFKNS